MYCGDVGSIAPHKNGNETVKWDGQTNDPYCQLTCDAEESCNNAILGCYGENATCALIGANTNSIVATQFECSAKHCITECEPHACGQV